MKFERKKRSVKSNSGIRVGARDAFWMSSALDHQRRLAWDESEIRLIIEK
jgi:hypothetical protein